MNRLFEWADSLPKPVGAMVLGSIAATALFLGAAVVVLAIQCIALLVQSLGVAAIGVLIWVGVALIVAAFAYGEMP